MTTENFIEDKKGGVGVINLRSVHVHFYCIISTSVSAHECSIMRVIVCVWFTYTEGKEGLGNMWKGHG